jgi:hypothetical protein
MMIMLSVVVFVSMKRHKERWLWLWRGGRKRRVNGYGNGEEDKERGRKKEGKEGGSGINSIYVFTLSAQGFTISRIIHFYSNYPKNIYSHLTHSFW